MDPTASLPDDALADILRRLPPCDLAASRCVRKAWRAVVDARRLLLPHILPHSVRGIFVNYIDYERPRFFARPSSTRPLIGGNLDFLPGYTENFSPIVDHCNGLLIYDGAWHQLFVVNPATRRWERLPPKDANGYSAYLVFDPAVSPHYEVFLLPRLPEKVDLAPRVQKPMKPKNLPQFSGPSGLVKLFSLPDDVSPVDETEEECEDDGPSESSPEEEYKDNGPSELSPEECMEKGVFPTKLAPSSSIESRSEQEDPGVMMEWPPSLWTLHVFSSSTRQWEERSFVREGEAAGTVADLRLEPLRTTFSGPRWRYGVYWRGVLYVHCRGAFITRLSLSDGKYRVIKAPIDIKESRHAQSYLGKSEKGVYLATIHDQYQLRVWILNESTSGQISWAPKHHIDLEPWQSIWSFHPKEIDKTWILEGDNKDEAGNNSMLVGENFEWNSDDDNVLNIEDEDEQFYGGVSVLGFHPYKEVIFLKVSSFEGLAYHLNSSEVQYLGKFRPKDYYCAHSNGTYESFPYTPCMIGELSIHA